MTEPLTFLAGQILPADDLQQYATITSPWQDYTPVWTAAAGTTTLGDGALVGRYQQIGSTVEFNIRFTYGSTTTQSTSGSDWSFSLPVDPYTGQGSLFWFVDVWVTDAGTGRYVGHGLISVTANTVNTIVMTGANTNMDNLTPMTWASGDRVNIKGRYEAAPV